MADIVERLRNPYTVYDEDMEDQGPFVMYREAADEIVRLRNRIMILENRDDPEPYPDHRSI